MTLPTVQDLLDRSWAPPAWPKGYACIYKATMIGTAKAYVGKTVDLRYRFQHHMLGVQVIDRVLQKHSPENFYIEILWIGFSENITYDQEASFIKEHRTNVEQGGYNLAEGGRGATSEDSIRWADRNNKLTARIRAALKATPSGMTTSELASSLGVAADNVRSAISKLQRTGHSLISEGQFGIGGTWRLYENVEEALDAWMRPSKTHKNFVLKALMERPHTCDEMVAIIGGSDSAPRSGVQGLRRAGYNIVSQGAGLRRPGTYNLIIDHKRHPWLHLGAMDLRGAVYDDRE